MRAIQEFHGGHEKHEDEQERVFFCLIRLIDTIIKTKTSNP